MTRPADRLELAARVDAGPETYRFETADGVCSTDAFRTPELLLAEHLWDRDPGDLLCLQANYGVVGTVLAPIAERVTMTESSARAARLCERNARANDAEAAIERTADLTALDRDFDTLAYAPKSYTALAVGQQRIADALAVLHPGGRLFLAAAPQTGLSRYEDCLQELADGVETVTERDDYHVLEATRPETLDPPQFVEPRQIRATVDGVDLSLVTAPGLFSAGRLDDGTRLLAETATVRDGDRVLDLCCGYGPLGVYAGRVADCDLWLSDDDCRATACTRQSLARAGVEGTVVTADCLRGVTDQRFDTILCNPPTHAGSGVLSDLFAGVEGVLAPGGVCWLVHHRALDLDSHLRGFETVERVWVGEEHVVVRLRA